jgi:hypothetical protein
MKQGAWAPARRPAKDRSRDVLAFCVQYHQNRPNINEMAAFQSLAIHLLKNDGNGFNTKGSVAIDVVPLDYKYKIRAHTHTETHTNTKPHTLTHSLTHSSHPTLPLTHSRTSTLFLVNDGRAVLGPWRPANDRSRQTSCIVHPVSIKIGQILTKWQRFKVWLFTY